MGHIPDGGPPRRAVESEHYRLQVEWYLDLARHTGPVCLGRAKGTASPRHYVQRQARAVFLASLYRLAPELSSDLLTLELSHMVAVANERRELFRYREVAKSSSTYANLSRANDPMNRYLKAWQERHHLTDPWCNEVACSTIALAYGLARNHISPPGPLPLVLPEDDLYLEIHDDIKQPEPGKSYGSLDRGFPELHRAAGYTVRSDDLKFPAIGLEEDYDEDEGAVGTFDPRVESVATAVKRILPELQSRLTRALEAFAAEDMRMNELVPTVRTNTAPFEWLVRYQVLEESGRQSRVS